jgi:DnaJ-class molecular chaperone
MAHAQPDECPDCNGRGWFYTDNGPSPQKWGCDECAGTGEYVWAGVIEAGLVSVALPVGMPGAVA